MNLSEPTLYCARCLTSFQADTDQCPNLSCRRSRPGDGWGRVQADGEVFDRNYRIIKLLAMGGAGITYLARELNEQDEEVGIKLAIKVLFSSRNEGSYLRRLATEAQIIQEMNHPHIVQYRGFVHRSGHSPYLITRYESGGSLLDHVRRVGTLPVCEAAAIGVQICQALQKGHEMGVIHRDLKPENVLLSAEVPPGEVPHVRVADFGIAKVSSTLNSNLTRAGVFVGTPHFAAPEQFLGAPVQPTSDVYSVGAMLHFCMMGRHLVRFADRLAPEDGYQILVDSLPAQINRPMDPPEDMVRMNRVLQLVMAPQPELRCTAVELEGMLAAIVAGAEPVIPDREALPLPSPTLEQDTGPLLSVHTLPTVRTAPLSQTAETVESTTEVDLPRDEPTFEVPQEPTAETSEGRTGCAVFGIAGALAAAVLVVAVGYGWTHPEVVVDALAPWRESGIEELTGDEEAPEQQEDYRLIYESLEALQGYLQQTCGVPDGAVANVELVIEGSGEIRVARVRDVAEAQCVRSGLERARVNRAGAAPVKMRKRLSW